MDDQQFGLLCRGVPRKLEHGEGVGSSYGRPPGDQTYDGAIVRPAHPRPLRTRTHRLCPLRQGAADPSGHGRPEHDLRAVCRPRHDAALKPRRPDPETPLPRHLTDEVAALQHIEVALHGGTACARLGLGLRRGKHGMGGQRRDQPGGSASG